MSSCAQPWPLLSQSQQQVSRILLQLPEFSRTESLIQFAVKLASLCKAQIRGLTLVDTSSMQEMVSTYESAAYAVFEQRRLEAGAERREAIRAYFSQACLAAGLDFDLHRKLGKLLEILPAESRFHDLSVVAVPLPEEPDSNGLTAEEATQLILRGVEPMLILRDKAEFPQRILLVQDGSQASSRAIRFFLSQGLFMDATVRLLAVGASQAEAQQNLKGPIDHVRSRRPGVETGCLAGRTSQIVPEYAQQWEADLVVLGAIRSPPMLRVLFGETVHNLLKKTPSAVYATH